MAGTDRRLHPLTLLFELGAGIRQIALPLIVVLFVSRSGSDERERVKMLSAVVALAFTAIAAGARYLSFTYRYDESELVVRSGIFVRKERHIPYDRIQNIDATQTLAHRLLGVVKLQVQTGAGAEPEASLNVLPASALAEVREHVFARRSATVSAASASTYASGGASAVAGTASADRDGAAAAEADQPGRPGQTGRMGRTLPANAAGNASLTRAPAETVLALPTRELLIAGFIENRGMVIILGAVYLLTRIDPLADLAADRIAAWVPGVSRSDFAIARLGGGKALLMIGAAFGMLLVFVRVLSTIWGAIRLHDFRLTRSGDDLRMEYGLFTRVSATISLRRIQTISVRETLLHRKLGRAAVQVATAGSGSAGSGGAAREWLAPIIPRTQLPMLLNMLHPGLALDAITWRGPHPKAFGRVARAALVMPLVVAGGSAFVIGEWAVLVGAVLIARALIRARTWVRNMGWTTLADGVAFRGGWLRRTTSVAAFARVQAVMVEESPLDRRAGMADVAVDTAAARLGIGYLAREDAIELENVLATRAAETRFTW